MEIKFRVWDEESKKLYMQDDFILVFENTGENILLDIDNEIIPLDNYKLMQYTGLKDCKGREIYEGDILKFKDGLITEVEISPAYGVYGVIDIASKRLIGKSKPEKTCEVIGNIYENKELFEA